MWKSLIGRLQHFVTHKLTVHLLKAVHEDELLIQTNRGWYVGKHRIRPEEMVALKEEAAQFQGSYLWKLMKKDVHFIAYLRGTAKAKTDADLIYSAAMYYDLELLEKFIERCKSL